MGHGITLPEAYVPKVGHGAEVGLNELDCACVSMVFKCIPFMIPPCTMEVLA